MTELSTEAKIRDLIALAGVLPQDVERAASNFRGLPDVEIDRRLDRLRAGKHGLKAWRIGHGLEVAASKAATGHTTDLVKQTVTAQEEIARQITDRGPFRTTPAL
jgi:hypothetical protein